MAEITASLVKELRERTGAGMMECKKALVEANGDIELAIDNMRKSGQAKAAKKAGRVAAEGVILARVQNGFGVLVEMNCETDFVAKDAGFLGLANEVADFAAANKGTTIEALQAQFEEKRAALVAKIGENMNIRRVAYLEGQVIAQYLHGAKIGVLVAGEGSEDEIKKACELCVEAKADYVKTSTGFSTRGATIEDVRIMKEAVHGKAKVKAAGGVRTPEDMVKIVAAGADRIGTSAGCSLVKK